MPLDLGRLYLLAGMVAHKAVWEVLKRRPSRGGLPFRRPLVKAVKLAVLSGIVAQTLLPEALPIAQDPFRLRLAGTVLYTLGLAIAVAARVQLGHNWSDIEAAEVKPAQTVVSTGVYRYIRHPIYTGDLLLLFGLELALNSWLVLGVLVLAPFVLRQAICEERMLRKTLPGYSAYCERTRRFIPFAL